jgi:hypothetical protein
VELDHPEPPVRRQLIRGGPVGVWLVGVWLVGVWLVGVWLVGVWLIQAPFI